MIEENQERNQEISVSDKENQVSIKENSKTEGQNNKSDNNKEQIKDSPLGVENPLKTEEEYDTMRKIAIQKRSLDHIPNGDFSNFVSFLVDYKKRALDSEEYMEAKDATSLFEACKIEYSIRLAKHQQTQSNKKSVQNYAGEKNEK